MAAVDEEEHNLEYFLNRATDPSKVDQDDHAVMSFCDRVNNELEGPQVALRLLAHKMQSPQEREALHALSTLEACVQNCGGRFHQEIGKFRFLNEMIKLVSPKYLGSYTSEKVKTRCIEMMFTWSSALQHEPKVREAYSMLKKQGIVKSDPVLKDVPPIEVPPPRANSLFEDDDKSKQLARLLKSKNPEDLQAANRLIKNMVKQDIEKTEKKSKRMQELETVNNNIKLLSEMLGHYSKTSSESDKEILKELYDSLEKRRPTLFRLASDTDEKENEAMMEILKTNDAVVKVMQQYQSVVEGKAENGLLLGTDTPSQNSTSAGNKSSMDELGEIFGGASSASAPQSAASGSADILQLNTPPSQSAPLSQAPLSQANLSSLYNSSGLGAAAPLTSTGASSLLPPSYTPTPQPTAPADDISILDTGSGPPSGNFSSLSGVASSTHQQSNNLQDLNMLGDSILQPTNSQQPAGASVPTSFQELAGSQEQQRKSGFSQLDDISMNLMKAQLGDGVQAKPFVPSNTPAPKLSLKEMQSQKQQQQNQQQTLLPTLASGGDVSVLDASPLKTASGTVTVQPLTDVHVKIETVQPGSTPPLTAYDKNNLKIVIHFGKDRPRSDVQVMVVSVMSTKTSAVKHFQFQAAVPKVMKVKLQPASATDLPAFNPILPSAAITQVMLVANPQNEKIRIKFKVTYTVDDKQESDIGDVEIPQQPLL